MATSEIQPLFEDDNPRELHSSQPYPSRSSSSGLVRASLLIVSYLLFGMLVYLLDPGHVTENPLVDSLYYCVVTLCTIGYGDVTPNSTVTKLFFTVYVLVGVGFIALLLLTFMVNHLLDLYDANLLKLLKRSYDKSSHYVDGEREGRVRIKAVSSSLLVFLFIVVGVFVIHWVERVGWVDSLYLVVMSVTTRGYGDLAFKSFYGRLFGSFWLLSSIISVAWAVLCLGELIVDQRSREMARRIRNNMRVSQFLDADLDRSDTERKAEFILQYFKEMGMISEEEIRACWPYG